MGKRLIRHFRREHLMTISRRAAERLAHTVPSMRGLDPTIRIGVTGFDASALLPRRVDVTLGELLAVLTGRRRVA
jgi:hypothetical protein